MLRQRLSRVAPRQSPLVFPLIATASPLTSPALPSRPSDGHATGHPLLQIPQRQVAAIAMRGGASAVIGLFGFILLQSARRTEWNERRRIRAVMRAAPKELLNFRPGPLFLPRNGKVSFLREQIDSDPSGPIVITGPGGSGKTMIIKKALAARPHTIYLSLRATPVTSGDALSLALVTKAGYLMPPTELLSRAIFNRDMSNTPTILAEIDRALKLVTEVLEEEKARGWTTDGRTGAGAPLVLPPLICIDELNLNEVGSGLLDDANFWKLVDWAMHISDNRLGHVMFACGLEVADMLDAYPGFRMRRNKLHFDFPRPGTVHEYFMKVVNPFLEHQLGAVRKPVPIIAPSPTAAVSEDTEARQVEAASEAGADGAGYDADLAAAVTPPSVDATCQVVAAPSVLQETNAITAKLSWWLPSSWFVSQTDLERAVAASSTKPVSNSTAAVTPLDSTAPDSGTDTHTHSSSGATDGSVAPPSTATQLGSAAEATRTEGVLTAGEAAAAGTPPVALISSVVYSEPRADGGHSVVTVVTTPTAAGNPSTTSPAASSLHHPQISTPASAPGEMGAGHDSVHFSDPTAATSLPVAVARAAAARAQRTLSEAQAQDGSSGSPSVAASTSSQPFLASVGMSSVLSRTGGTIVPGAVELVPAPTVSMTAPGSSTTEVISVQEPRLNAAPATAVDTNDIQRPAVQSARGQSASDIVAKATAAANANATARDHTSAGSGSSGSGGSGSGSGVGGVSRMLPWEWDARIESVDPDRDQRMVLPVLYMLEQWEVDRIVDIVGGHLKDIDTVVSAITRGKHWAAPLERMVADSCDLVERTLDEILSSGAGSAAPTPQATKAKNKDAGGSAGQLLPRARSGARLGLSGFVNPAIPSIDYIANPTAERLAAYARYLRAWALLSALSERKYIPRRDLVSRIFPECPHELDFFIDCGLIMSVNVKTSAKMHVGGHNPSPVGSTGPHSVLGATATSGSGGAGTTSLTLPGTYVSASSPRMRVAFRVLAADAKLQAQTVRVAACVAMARLRAEEEAVMRHLPELTTERAFAMQHHSVLLARDTALRGTLAKEMLGAGMFPALTSPPPKQTSVGSSGSSGAGGQMMSPSSSEGSGSGNTNGSSVNGSFSAMIGMAFPLGEDVPAMGMQSLLQGLRRSESALHSIDDEIGRLRGRLAEIRGGIIAAQRKAEQPIPGTEDAFYEFTSANDKTAAALGALVNTQVFHGGSIGTDSDVSDDEASALPHFAPRSSRRGATNADTDRPTSPQELGQAASGAVTSDATSVSDSSAFPHAAPPPPPAMGSSLEIYRGNTARAIQMTNKVAGYYYRDGSWEYVTPTSEEVFNRGQSERDGKQSSQQQGGRGGGGPRTTTGNANAANSTGTGTGTDNTTPHWPTHDGSSTDATGTSTTSGGGGGASYESGSTHTPYGGYRWWL